MSVRKRNISAHKATGACGVGAHITSMKAEDTEWSAATGWAWDSHARASPYVRINVLKRL